MTNVPEDGAQSFARFPRGMGELISRQPRGNDSNAAQDMIVGSEEPQPETSRISLFMSMPPELIDEVLSYLSPYELASASATCHRLRSHAISDVPWQRIVQEHVPCTTVSQPYPCDSFRQLYAAHDRLWFLPKHKIWFCDSTNLAGKLMLVRYDPRRGCIEGFRLLAISDRTTYEPWPTNPHVMIHSFEPKVRLHLDLPELQFKVEERQEDEEPSTRREKVSFQDEIPMPQMQQHFRRSSLLLTKAISREDAGWRLEAKHPYGDIWPPPAVPAHQRTIAAAIRDLPALEVDPSCRPQHRSDVSGQLFRIKSWTQLPARLTNPHVVRDGDTEWHFSIGPSLNFFSTGSHLGGGQLITYSTLPPELYTPTPTKPWRGIWVGDYSGHGCEFLLINQPDDPPATDAELDLVRLPEETGEEWEKRRLEARVHRGRLEAIKLTGDPNVPRGEYSFVVDDLGPEGLVGVASGEPFEGARVVKSKGHVAHTGFVDDTFIESQLFLLGPDRLAQYWVDFGHISFFQRIGIDDYLDTGRGV